MSERGPFYGPTAGRRSFLKMTGAAALTLTLSGWPAGQMAWAQSLADLRASGVVGERFDGYVVVRDAGASNSVRQEITTINAKRLSIYRKRAAEQGVSVAQVGRVYAQQIIRDAPAGTWLMDEAGHWKQKK